MPGWSPARITQAILTGDPTRHDALGHFPYIEAPLSPTACDSRAQAIWHKPAEYPLPATTLVSGKISVPRLFAEIRRCFGDIEEIRSACLQASDYVDASGIWLPSADASRRFLARILQAKHPRRL